MARMLKRLSKTKPMTTSNSKMKKSMSTSKMMLPPKKTKTRTARNKTMEMSPWQLTKTKTGSRKTKMLMVKKIKTKPHMLLPNMMI